MTIERDKSGLNRFFPKYTLTLSEGNKFLLCSKKQAGSATSSYMISMDQENPTKQNSGFLGRVKSNFLGTEFNIFDSGENPNGKN